MQLPDWLTAARARVVIAAICAFLAGGVIAISVDWNGDGQADQTIEISVNQAPDDGLPTKEVSVPEAAVDKARGSTEVKDLETAPPESQPPSDAQLERSAAVQSQVKPLPEAGAVQGFNGCVTRILPVNYSSRNGARATEFVLHYTVSHNVPGWSDVNAIVALFSNPARQASSNFVIDAEGNCSYIVPIEAKAWTQAGGNPWSVSVEVIAFGDEGVYLGAAGWAKLKSVAQQVHNRTGIPLRRGAVSSSCTPIRSGIVQHKDFGLCGGGHVDITPFSVDDAVRRLGAPAAILTAKELKIVKGVRHPKGTGHSRRYWCQRLGNQITWLAHSPGVPRHDRRLAILRRVRRESC